MSAFGIGLAAVGRPAYINAGRAGELPGDRGVEAMRRVAWDVLDAAHAAGVRWVDAARSYGRAEEFLAGWLDARGHRDVTVSSKWGYAYVGGWRMDAAEHEVKEHSLPRFRAQLAETRRWLGDRVAFYQVHSLTVDSPLFGDDALLGALAEARDGGLRLGFSTSGPRQAQAVRRGLELEIGGRRLFDAVQSTWNPLEPSAGPALQEARDAGARVIVKEALANGRLAVRPPAPLEGVAGRHRVGPDAIALAAAAAQPWAGVVLLGSAGPAQVTANLAARGLDLTPGDLAELAGLAEPAEAYWAARAALPWT